MNALADGGFFDRLFAQQLVAGVIAGLVTGLAVGLIVLAAQGGLERRRIWNRVALDVAVLWEAVLDAGAEPNPLNIGRPTGVLRAPAGVVAAVATGQPLSYWHDVLMDDERLHVIELFMKRKREFDIAARRFELVLSGRVRRRNAEQGVLEAADEADIRFVCARVRGVEPDEFAPFLPGSREDAERRLNHFDSVANDRDAIAFVAADAAIQDAIDLLIDIADDEDPTMDPRSYERSRRQRLISSAWYFQPFRALLSWFALRGE